MSRTQFYDDNRNRRYPFVSTEEIESSVADDEQIPDSALLDCGFTFYAYSGFEADQHSVWLDSVSRTSSTVTLIFKTNAPGLTGLNLDFVFERNAGESQILFTDAVGTGANPVAGGCTNQMLWMGYAVLGDSEDLVSWIGGSSRATDRVQHTVEPALSQNLDKAYVRSVNLANRRRVRTTDVPGEERPILINAQCLQGPARFIAGRNCRIDYDVARNGLVISADLGAGDGEVCSELPVHDDEVPPDDGDLLSGGPACTEVVKTVNGVGGPRLILRGTDNILVEKDPVIANKINVRVAGAFLAAQEPE